MVNKEDFLSDLRKYLEFEEGIIKQLANFYLVLGWKDYVSFEDQGRIEKGLDILKNDSQKHVNLVEEMIRYIEGAGKNEF